MHDAFAIAAASTPIVKFKDAFGSGSECDVNVNDLGGWSVSILLELLALMRVVNPS